MDRPWPLTVVVLVAAAVAIGACGGGSGTRSSGAVTLHVWVRGTEGKAITDVLPEFERAHPGIDVRVTDVPNEASHEKYLAAIAGQSTPDVALLGTTWMAEFAGTGALEPVPADMDMSQFFPSSVSTTTVGGTRYGVPWYVETRALFYRTDIAQRAGVRSPPRTWDELKAMARAMQRDGGAQYGIHLSTSNWLEFMPFVWQAGGDVLQDDHVVLDSPEAAEAFTFYKSFFDEGLTPTNQRTDFQIVPAFVRGTHPMFFSGPWQMRKLDAAGGPGFDRKWAVAPVPSHRTGLSFVGGGNWAVFRSSSHRDAAWAFVRWASGPRTQARFYELSNLLPANRTAWTLPALTGSPYIRVFGEQLEHARSPTPTPRWERVSHALETNLDTLLRGGESGAAGARRLNASVAAVAHE
jgi:multiple sugar transport system substrate-binding protein